MTDDIQNDTPEPTIRDTMREVMTGADTEQNAVESTVNAAETPAPRIDQGDKQEGIETDATPEVAKAIQAPVSWSEQDKQIFAKLPPDAQNIIARREGERDKHLIRTSDELSRFKQEIGGIDSAFESINHIMRDNNMTKQQAISELVGLYQNYRNDPIGYLTKAAQSAGIDLQKLASGQIDPMSIQTQSLQNKVADLENKLASFGSREDTQKNEYAQLEINKFADNPENKYFTDVREDMALLLENGKAKDMADAYEKACRLNPDIFDAVQKERAKAAANKKNADALNARKGAGVKLKTREVSSTGVNTSGSIRDTMRQAIEDLSEGAAA